MSQPLVPKPGSKIKLRDFDPRYCEGLDKKDAEAEVAKSVRSLVGLTDRLYCENKRSVLLVLQGMDTSGKDGTIRQVFEGVNPQSCQVYSFKQPSLEELDHDFLWRLHREAPRRGNVGIFNRSHYEDVLVVRVHSLVPEAVWRERYEQINAFEKLLVDNGTTIVKVFLHISKDEQRERLESRIREPQKNWKFSIGDLAERKLWDKYQEAYEDAISRCNTEHAPWHIVPADRKWYRNFVVSRLLREMIEKLDPQYPPPPEGLDKIVVE